MNNPTVPPVLEEMLVSFDRLSVEEQKILAKEILKRLDERPELPPLEDEELVYLSDQLFQMYDKEEEENGTSPSPPW
jgi:hypothetical protein